MTFLQRALAAAAVGALFSFAACSDLTTPTKPPVALVDGTAVRIVINENGGCSGSHIGGGRILTAGHCIPKGGKWTVVTEAGEVFPAEALWSDMDYDVGLLMAPGLAGHAGATVGCRAPAIGDEVGTIGSPLGHEFLHVWGRVAQSVRELQQPRPNPSWLALFAVDLTGAAGLSGGPLYATTGEIVGIVVAGPGVKLVLRSIMFAVPGDMICKLIADHAA